MNMYDDEPSEMAEFEKSAREEMELRFSAADEKYMDMLEEYVAGGFCEMLARLAIYLGKERAERALGKLPEEMRAEIERRIDALGDKTSRADRDVIREAEQIFETKDIESKQMADSVIEGAAQQILVAIHRERDTLFARNPVLMNSIERHMFILDDIVHIDDRGVQIVLREVERMTLAKALRGKNAEAVREKIFRNMSKRAVEMLKEDMEFMGPIRIRDIVDAQNEILDIIKRMEKSGDIIIPKFEEDAFLI